MQFGLLPSVYGSLVVIISADIYTEEFYTELIKTVYG